MKYTPLETSVQNAKSLYEQGDITGEHEALYEIKDRVDDIIFNEL